jgi:hypothetical protein
MTVLLTGNSRAVAMWRMLSIFLKSCPVFWGVALLVLGVWGTEAAQADVTVSMSVSGPEQMLKTWDPSGLGNLKAASSLEKDPVSGRMTRYKGVLLSQLLEKTVAGLSAERRAQVDLLVFKSASGGTVLMPRSVVTQYPVLVALREGKASIVMPWTSKSKIMKECLPIESYFVSDLTGIELSNYNERYTSVFLKRRTDPLAMRGEKMFVQNCVGCHSETAKPTLADLSAETPSRRLASEGHPATVKGAPHLDDRARRALVSYLEAFRAENTAKTAAVVTGQ